MIIWEERFRDGVAQWRIVDDDDTSRKTRWRMSHHECLRELRRKMHRERHQMGGPLHV